MLRLEQPTAMTFRSRLPRQSTSQHKLGRHLLAACALASLNGHVLMLGAKQQRWLLHHHQRSLTSNRLFSTGQCLRWPTRRGNVNLAAARCVRGSRRPISSALRSGEKLNLAVAGHTDNLSSIAVITDESGAVAERLSYDAWGKRRFPNGADDPSGNLNSRSQTTRGFTGQEELADVGLVHLNGRVYDPLGGRMMSADPFVPDPLNGQAWNRYSYVINNPLAFTDPNGYCFLGMCSWGKAISTFFGRSFGVLFREFPILGNLFEIGASMLSVFCGPLAPVCAVAAAFTSTTFVVGVSSGNLGYALRAGFTAAATAAAFYVV